MGLLGGGIGAAVGSVLFGPLGAGAGAALGALLEDWLDEGEEEQAMPTLPISLSHWETREGRTYLLEPQFDGSRVAAYAIRFRHNDESWVRARESYRDEDGDFLMCPEPLQSDGATAFFVPRGSLVLNAHVEDLILEVAIIGEDELLGVSRFDDPQVVAGYSLDPIAQARPLLDLARTVVCADGDDIVEASRQALREALEVEPSEELAFRRAWESAGSADLADDAFEVMCRFPGVEPSHILDLAGDLLCLRSKPSPGGVARAQEIAVAFDIDPEAWAEAAGLLGHVAVDELADAYAVLGIPQGTDFAGVREAYRTLMKDYHPDVVAHLPRGYQEYATQRSQEINAAYQVVLERLHEGRQR